MFYIYHSLEDEFGSLALTSFCTTNLIFYQLCLIFLREYIKPLILIRKLMKFSFMSHSLAIICKQMTTSLKCALGIAQLIMGEVLHDLKTLKTIMMTFIHIHLHGKVISSYVNSINDSGPFMKLIVLTIGLTQLVSCHDTRNLMTFMHIKCPKNLTQILNSLALSIVNHCQPILARICTHFCTTIKQVWPISFSLDRS